MQKSNTPGGLSLIVEMTGRRSFLLTLISLCCVSLRRTPTSGSKLPRVLILGDSIAKGYFPRVKELLDGKCELYRPLDVEGRPINCMGTKKGLLYISTWLMEDRWDIIHFNFGLHDLKHVDPETGKGSSDPTHPVQTIPSTYLDNLEQLVKTMRNASKRLIFATTTPVPNGVKTAPFRQEGAEEAYNEAAKDLMEKYDVFINDLHALCLSRKGLQKPNNVHMTKKGYHVLANEVANKIGTYLT